MCSRTRATVTTDASGRHAEVDAEHGQRQRARFHGIDDARGHRSYTRLVVHYAHGVGLLTVHGNHDVGRHRQQRAGGCDARERVV